MLTTRSSVSEPVTAIIRIRPTIVQDVLILPLQPAALKFLTLYVVLVRLAAPQVVPAAKLPVVSAMFTWPQLATALLGGLLACLIAPVVFKALDARKS